MSDWQTVRHDPNWDEPLDPEMIPLCDALNAAGFVTTASCVGHGSNWPMVWFEHGDNKRIESMIRYVLEAEKGDYRSYTSCWRRKFDLDGYSWSIRINCWNVYRDTPDDIAQKEYEDGINNVAQQINCWFEMEGGWQ